MNVLLVNPPIYDFSAYDFWLKPYGMLQVAGLLRDIAEIKLYDFLDRFHPDALPNLKSDEFGRGVFMKTQIDKPDSYSDIKRRYHRFGLPSKNFTNFLSSNDFFDIALIQTGMTYWYQGVREAIETIRKVSSETKIVLGGVYATLCYDHAMSLGPDIIIKGANLMPLWEHIGITPAEKFSSPYWEGYNTLKSGVMKLSYGCPFTCTYCAVKQIYKDIVYKPLNIVMNELHFLIRRGVSDISFYDDALLFNANEIFIPFINRVIKENIHIRFHVPNAINARFVDDRIAVLMKQAGFKKIYIGFESKSILWQKQTGGKVYEDEFLNALKSLVNAGFDRNDLTAYLILGHPLMKEQEIEDSMKFCHDAGIRIMLAEYSPIPGTPDAELTSGTKNMCDPLTHNKTAAPIRLLGFDKVQHYKNYCKELNRSLSRR